MDKATMAGLADAGKVAMTGIPSAVVVDVGMQAWAPATMTPTARHITRAALGAGLSLVALMAGAPGPYAAGPLAANASVAAVDASRAAGWGARLREQMERARAEARRLAGGGQG